MTPRALWTSLLLLILLSPLPLGSNRPLAWSALALVSGLLLLWWASLVQWRRLRVFWRPTFWPPLAVLALLFLWIFLQSGLVPTLGGNPLWEMAGVALGKDLGPAIGLAPDAALVGTLKLLTYVAIFWLVLQLGRDSERAWQLLRWFAWASAAYATYGLINYFAGNRWLLWSERWAYPNDVTSTFVSRNHYATVAALGMLAATALSIKAFNEKWRVGDRSLPRFNRSVDALVGKSLTYLIVALIVAMAWLQTHSRMGFAAGAAGMLTFLFLLRNTGTIRSRWALPVMIVLLPLLLISVSGDGTLARLNATSRFDRAALFERVAIGIDQSPWVGYGYGSFPAVFQMFRDATIWPGAEYKEAHSSYLEIAFDLGLPAAALLLAAMAWLAVCCFIGAYTRTKDRVIPALGAAASVVVAVHAIADFSLQIPAVACCYSALLGVGVAQSSSRKPSK